MKRILCFLFGHQYGVVKEFGHGQRMVACKRCRNRWAMHDGLELLLPWDNDFTQLYAEQEHQ